MTRSQKHCYTLSIGRVFTLMAASVVFPSPGWSQPLVELETGAPGKFKGNSAVSNCSTQLSSKVARASLEQEPPPDLGKKPAENVRYLSLTLEVTNRSPKGTSLCDIYSGNIMKTEFKLFADDQTQTNIYPIFKWPSIDQGTTKDVKLLFEVPENARNLVLTGHSKEERLAAWTLPELTDEYLAEQAEKHKAFLSKELYRAEGASIAGNPDGDITVVEFFDANCGYCKSSMLKMKELIQDDSRVRVVFMELPILSKGSEEAAIAALAAKRQGKYWEFHQALLTSKGRTNAASSLKIAQELGLDTEKMKADMKKPEIVAELNKMQALAKRMGIRSTPYFLVGDKVIAGAVDDLNGWLKRYVSDFRKSNCGYC